jgi:hypothetical protein
VLSEFPQYNSYGLNKADYLEIVIGMPTPVTSVTVIWKRWWRSLKAS